MLLSRLFFSEKKSKLQSHLEVATFVSLTADAWSDRRANEAYLGVTVHLFVSGQPLFLLAFRSFDVSHTGQRIADELDAIITESGINGKVCFIVSDNASIMKKAMSILFDGVSSQEETIQTGGMFFDDATLWKNVDMDEVNVGDPRKSIQCFAHSLQLVV